MKRIIALCIAAAILLSLCTVTAFAKNGPMEGEGFGMGGGARIGFSQLDESNTLYVVIDKGNGIEIDNSAFPGASYDKASNTLTLKDADASNYSMFIWYMGDDFTIAVEGDCAVGVIYVTNQFDVYNTNLHITGDGSLTVNESKENEASIWMFGDGENNEQKLTVDASVTLHLYGGGPNNMIINNYGTSAATDAEAISVGGRGVDGVVGERIVYTDYDEANIMVVDDADGEYTEYNTYSAKSKSDPDGKYSVHWWDGDSNLYVSHYVFLESIGLWVDDLSFGGYGQKSYTREAFDEEFTVEQSSQPTKIRYTTDEREENKGWSLVLLERADEPGEVYGGSPIWGSPGSSRDEPDEYIIYHVVWDEEQNIYLKDETFPYMSVYSDEIEDAGFSFVYETHTENQEFVCWRYPAPFDDDNYNSHFDLIACASDPDGIYVQSGESYSTDDDGNRINEKIIVKKVHYDAANDAYYLTAGYDDQIYVPLGEIGGEYSYVTHEVTKKQEIRYITSDYNFNFYSSEAMLAELAGDTSPYSVESYRNKNGETEYTIHKLELRENGHYYAVKWEPSDKTVYGHGATPAKFAEDGYSFVMSMQNTPFTHIGKVDFMTAKKYTDARGNLYAVDWGDDVYSYSESGVKATFGDTTYYLAEASDKTPDELISTEHEEETDSYRYYLCGEEYHFASEEDNPASLLGDADNDSKLTILDATAIQRKLANLPTASFNEKAADADEDTKVTILDATAIQRKLASLPTHEGIGTKMV